MFGRRKVIGLPTETTLNRHRIAEAQQKLYEAEALKRRSSKVAKSLDSEQIINHYASRLLAAYRLSEGKH